MKKWKCMSVIATMALAPLTLTACLGDSGGGKGGHTIELWTAWTEGEATQKASQEMIAQFEKEHNLTVKQTNFTYDTLHEKLVASAAGGNLPDAVWGLPEWVGEFNKLGILADLSDSWNYWADKDKVSEAVKAAMTVNGKIIGFPYETTTRAYLVHDNLLADSGTSVPKTWEDVLAIGSKVEDATGSSAFGVAGAGVRAPQELLVYLAQKGLKIADEQAGGYRYRNTWQDDPAQLAKATAVFQFYADLMHSGAVNPNSPTYGWEKTDENFVTGRTATYVTGNWLAEREKSNADTMGDVSVHPIPYPTDGKPATYIEAKPLMVMRGSHALDGATQLAQAFASEEWQTAAFADRSALNTVSIDSKWSKDFQTLQASGVTFPPINLGTITQSMIDSLAMVLQEGKSPKEAATWLSNQINDSLKTSGDLAE